MTYITDNTQDMTYDEYTYHVDMMLMAESGEPATFEQLSHISTAYEQGLAPDDAFAAIADMHHDGENDAEWAIFDDLLAVA
mgnify:CR=1 FL=1